MRNRFVFAVALTAALSSAASAQVLYDGTLGTSPGTQGWFSFLGGGTESLGGGTVTYSSAALNLIQGGYSRFDAILPSAQSYTLSTTLQVLSETHDGVNGPNRAGVSLIALSDNLQGIEIGFWGNRIWVQSGPDFQQAEGIAFDTTSALTRYDLTVSGGNYSLTANGAAILAGPLRNYSSFGSPYDITNFIFIGDDTTSARGSFSMSRVELSTSAASAPEPTALAVAVLGLPLLARRRRG